MNTAYPATPIAMQAIPAKTVYLKPKTEPKSRSGELPKRGPAELHMVLDRMLRCFSENGRDIFLTRLCERDLFVTIPQAALSRVLFCILECVYNGEQWRNGRPTQVYIRSEKRLNGMGVLLEVLDDGPALPRKLMYELSEMDHLPANYQPGWPLLQCKTLVERHGGRLLVSSPMNGKKKGVHIRLFLPLFSFAQ